MDIWKKLQKTERPIVLYGMGNGAQMVLRQLHIIGKKAAGIFASDGFVRGQIFEGYTVQSYSALAQLFPDMIILVCFGSGRKEVLEYIDWLSERHTVYCPDVPVYGETIFDREFVEQHRVELEQVYRLLGDGLSRQTFENMIEFKLFGDSRLLKAIEYDQGLFAPLELSGRETYLDLGAYRGDTVEQFISVSKEYHKIFALEPNKKTFKKLCENVQNYENVFPIYGAISDYDGEGGIHSAGRGSTILKTGENLPVYTIDTLMQNETVSLIKMDVEGQELAAISGAKKILQRCKPKLIVAAYHRSEDVFSLPLTIHSICPDYRILLRHTPHNLAWDTNFYFI